METRNIFTKEDVSVEVTTIHSAKGETHFATLYLETSYYSNCESDRIMSYLLGNYITPTEDRIKKTLKMAYVGMSRPQYMLCVAISNKSYNCALDKKNGGHWDVVHLSS